MTLDVNEVVDVVVRLLRVGLLSVDGDKSCQVSESFWNLKNDLEKSLRHLVNKYFNKAPSFEEYAVLRTTIIESNPIHKRSNLTFFTFTKLAMNGGQVHDPKLRTIGRDWSRKAESKIRTFFEVRTSYRIGFGAGSPTRATFSASRDNLHKITISFKFYSDICYSTILSQNFKNNCFLSVKNKSSMLHIQS